MPRIGIWTFRVMGDERGANESIEDFDNRNQEAHDEAKSLLGELEDMASNKLPEGYYARFDSN